MERPPISSTVSPLKKLRHIRGARPWNAARTGAQGAVLGNPRLESESQGLLSLRDPGSEVIDETF